MENTTSLSPCICTSKGYNLIVDSNVHFYAIYAFGIFIQSDLKSIQTIATFYLYMI